MKVTRIKDGKAFLMPEDKAKVKIEAGTHVKFGEKPKPTEEPKEEKKEEETPKVEQPKAATKKAAKKVT